MSGPALEKARQCATSRDTAWQTAEWKAFCEAHSVTPCPQSDEDWLPTPHGLTLAQAVVSPAFPSLHGRTVLELGAGVGNHTVLLLRKKPAQLTATEYSAPRLESTKRMLVANDLLTPSVHLITADWLRVEPLRVDMVITNPPFCRSGQQNRRYFIDELILNAHRVLNPGGQLVFVQSSMANLKLSMESLTRNGFDARVVHETKHPWRKYYFDDPAFLAESEFEGSYEVGASGERIETLSVIVATLRPYAPPAFAH